MAHSYIVGAGLEFEVRDSICESVLERLRDELRIKGSSSTALELVTEWYDYWYSMPPGCKELMLETQVAEVQEAVANALSVVISKLDPEGEQLRVAKQIEQILIKV